MEFERRKVTGLVTILFMGWFSGFWLLQEWVDGAATLCDEQARGGVMNMRIDPYPL